MKITLVVDSYDDASNGVAISTKRIASLLVKEGHDVFILTSKFDQSKNEGIKGISLGIKKVPILYSVSKKQGFFFSKINKKLIDEVVLNSDVVHFNLQFKMERYVKKVCDIHKIPTTSSFHIQPEHITSTLRLGKIQIINKIIMLFFKKFYDKFDYIHCPSKMVENEIKKYNFKAKNIVTISNGFDDKFKKLYIEKDENLKDKIVVCMVGRFSKEKRQDLIINAIKKSKYEDNICLIFAGKGILKNKLEHMGNSLTNKPIFAFYSEDELINVLNNVDIYVHASDFETEGMSCIEAIACGNVPIISDSKYSATSQFAIDDKNLFKSGDYMDLSKKIDFWIENNEFRKLRETEYLEFIKKYTIENTTKEFIKFLNSAVEGKEVD